MKTSRTQPILRAQSGATNASEAVRALAEELPRDAACTLVFASGIDDLDTLGAELRSAFDHPVIGCTSAGVIGPEAYDGTGLSAISFAGDAFEAEAILIEPLAGDSPSIEPVIEAAQRVVEEAGEGEKVFGVLLVDGLSNREELLVAELFMRTAPFPIVGGSAGDDLAFDATHILHGESWGSDRAVLILFKTSLPFVPFQLQHHKAGEELLVVTAADPEQRIVHELNGEPAAEVYARTIGIGVEELTPEVFSGHALALRIGEQEFLRSIRSVLPDGSLDFYCAIDRGVVLRIARTQPPVAVLREKRDELEAELGGEFTTLCFDCILRKLEINRLGLTDEVGEELRSMRAVGFSTYGEQFNALHVNQTLIGVAIGERPEAA